MRLSEVWTLYEQDKRLLGYSPHTLKSYRLQCILLIRHFGDVDVQDIAFEALKAYLAKDAERLKPASIGHRVRFLKSLFRWATDEGYCAPNPAAKLQEPKLGRRIPKFIPSDVLEELRLACRTPLEYALVEFLYSTGCRIGEVYQLNLNSIDWNRRSVLVRGKGDQEREAFFSLRAAILLRRYLRGRRDSDTALFVTERAPRRMSIAQLRYVIKRIAHRASVDVNVFPHKFRHSFAMHLLEKGAPLDAIQNLLGHQKRESTLIYVHMTGEHRRQLYETYF